MSHDGCKICGNLQNNRTHTVREMMLGIGDSHDYLECAECGCIQIVEIPPDMHRYYGESYYSYQIRNGKPANGISDWLRRKWIGGSYGSGGALGAGLKMILGHKKTSYGYFLRRLNLTFDARILDVGSGAGDFVRRLLRDGFRHISGIDYYVPGDIHQDGRLIVKKAQIHDVAGDYDLVIFNNSFEHMDDQAKVIRKAHELLSPQRYLILIIPLCDSFAFRKYGRNWVQWDAPRHFYLHTQQSINLLCRNHGFQLVDVIYNSSHFQFEGSELYLRGYALHAAPNPQSLLGKRRQFAKAAESLNAINDGDSAVFVFQKDARSTVQ